MLPGAVHGQLVFWVWFPSISFSHYQPPWIWPCLSDPSSYTPATTWRKKSPLQLFGPGCDSVDSLGCSCWGIPTTFPIISPRPPPASSIQQLQSYLLAVLWDS